MQKRGDMSYILAMFHQLEEALDLDEDESSLQKQEFSVGDEASSNENDG